MHASSVNLLVVGLSLLCFIDPLCSDPQQPYWANYEPVDPRSHPIFPQHYDPPNIQRPASRVAQYEGQTKSSYQMNQFQHFPASLNYPERVPEVYPRYHDFVSTDREEKSEESEVNFEEEDVKGNVNEEEILEKMRILDKLLSEDSTKKDLDTNGIEDGIIPEESRRVVRQVRKQRPGFFWTLARITFEAVNDTRSAIKQISDIINNNIVPDSATQSTMMRASLTDAGSTTTEGNRTTGNTTETTTTSPMTTTPFVLTRARLQSLIRRNVLGLVRIFNIEWRDALNQSEITVKQFQKDLGNQVGTYLRDNPDAY